MFQPVISQNLYTFPNTNVLHSAAFARKCLGTPAPKGLSFECNGTMSPVSVA